MNKEIYIIGSAPEYTDNKVVRKKLLTAYLVSLVFILLGIAVGVMSYLKVQADKIAAYEKQVRIETEHELEKETNLRKKTERMLKEETERRITTENQLDAETKKSEKFEKLYFEQVKTSENLKISLQDTKTSLDITTQEKTDLDIAVSNLNKQVDQLKQQIQLQPKE